MFQKTRDKKLWIGIGVSLFFLFLLFRKTDFHKMLTVLAEMNYYYILPAVISTFISYYFRAVRWKYLLKPLKNTTLRNLFPSTIIGYMANNLLPARLGEFVRAYVLGQKESLKFGAVFASLVMDRLCDGFSVLLILLIAFFTVVLPPDMEQVQHGMVAGGYVTLAIYFAVLFFLIVLKKRTMKTIKIMSILFKPFPAKVSEKIIPFLGSFIEGVRLSSRPSDFLGLLITSALVWLFATWPIDLILRSFGICLPFTASMFIMVFLVFAVLVPASPGYVGTYHAACVYGLMAFNVQKEKALSIALIIHGISFFPVIVAGFYYLCRDKFSLQELSSKSSRGTTAE
jgi:glycosyltransferase 2 family protein